MVGVGRCLLAVFSRLNRQLAPLVFSLFLFSSYGFAAQDSTHPIKRFAQICGTGAAKIVTHVKSVTPKIKSLVPEKIEPKDVALFPFKATWHTLKGTAYPLWFLGKGGYEYARSKKPSRMEAAKEVLENRFKKDKWSMLVGGVLWGLQQTTGLTVNQFHKLTSDFEEDDDGEEGTIVVIDNFGEDRFYAGAGKYVYEKLYLPKYGQKRVVYLQNVSMYDLPKILKQISPNRPIQKLDYYGHGLVGLLENFGNLSDSIGTLNTGYTPLYDLHLSTPTSYWINSFFTGKLEPQVFAKNAKIRFNSCFVGNGPTGDLFARAIANSWLRQGGTVYMANTQILPSAGEYLGLKANLPIPPQFVRSVTDHLVPLRGAATAYTLLSEIPSMEKHPERVERPFLTPGTRVTIHKTEGESPLRNDFEKAWASKFRRLQEKSTYDLYDPSDVTHFTRADYSDLALIPPYASTSFDDHRGKGAILKFSSPEQAAYYFKKIQIDSEIVDKPILENDSIRLSPKANADSILKKREFATYLSFAQNAKLELRKVRSKKLAEANGDKRTIQKIEAAYQEYLEMLPAYAFPYYNLGELPSTLNASIALDELKTP